MIDCLESYSANGADKDGVMAFQQGPSARHKTNHPPPSPAATEIAIADAASALA